LAHRCAWASQEENALPPSSAPWHVSAETPSDTHKGGGTTGARGALAPFKFAEGRLSPPYVMAL